MPESEMSQDDPFEIQRKWEETHCNHHKKEGGKWVTKDKFILICSLLKGHDGPHFCEHLNESWSK